MTSSHQKYATKQAQAEAEKRVEAAKKNGLSKAYIDWVKTDNRPKAEVVKDNKTTNANATALHKELASRNTSSKPKRKLVSPSKVVPIGKYEDKTDAAYRKSGLKKRF